MDWSTLGYIVLACLSVIFILCSCMGRRESGAIISPPVTTIVVPTTGTAPYPTQTGFPMPTPAYPYPTIQTQLGPPPPGLNVQGGMAYPMPTPMYPNSAAPYPNSAAPYPTQAAPYPPTQQGPPYPHNATHDMNPPSYTEAVGHEAYLKQSPYNPSHPHS